MLAEIDRLHTDKIHGEGFHDLFLHMALLFFDFRVIYIHAEGKPQTHETEEKKMTKKEIAEIIESKAAEEIAKGAKFAAEINSMGLSYERTF